MKRFGFLFLLTGTVAFMFLGQSSKGSTALNPDIVSISSKNTMTLTAKTRQPKVSIDPAMKNEDNGGILNLEDYRPIDPVPSSTDSIKPGPIQHGTPLMPYIPEPSPPPRQEKHELWLGIIGSTDMMMPRRSIRWSFLPYSL